MLYITDSSMRRQQLAFNRMRVQVLLLKQRLHLYPPDYVSYFIAFVTLTPSLRSVVLNRLEVRWVVGSNVFLMLIFSFDCACCQTLNVIRCCFRYCSIEIISSSSFVGMW